MSSREIMNRIAAKQRKKHRISITYMSSKGNAKKKGMIHELNLQDVRDIFEKQKGLCYYTGKPMVSNLLEGGDPQDSVSMDRIDPTKGYIKGNVVLCRWVVNRVKNDLTIEELLELLEQIKGNLNGNTETNGV